jgi:hypothetical protein
MGEPANAEERQAPRGEGRSDAGEDIGARRSCPYVESSLQKSVGGNGPKKRGSQRFKGETRERGSSPRMTILARKHTRIARPCAHQRKPRGAASVTGEAGGDTKPEAGSVTLQRHESGAEPRSVTCKGHAESRITCREKAPRIAKAPHASRRAEWKRSWQSSPHALGEKSRIGRARSEECDRGVRVGRSGSRSQTG